MSLPWNGTALSWFAPILLVIVEGIENEGDDECALPSNR